MVHRRAARRLGAVTAAGARLTPGTAAHVWIGGGPATGAPAVARALARRLDLRHYPLDAAEADHAARAQGEALPVTSAFAAMTEEQRWLDPSPEEMADTFEAIARERVALVLADLEALGPGATVVVEGPQLLPGVVAAASSPGDVALFLVPPPEPEPAPAARESADGPPLAPDELAAARRAERDRALAARVAAAAASVPGATVVEVDGSRPVEETVAPAVAAVEGVVLREERTVARSAMRRRENTAVAAQIRAWWQAAGDTVPEPPTYPWACECGRSGCEEDVVLTVPVFAVRSATGPLVAPAHL